jgi:3-oxoacid CoA-transferase
MDKLVASPAAAVADVSFAKAARITVAEADEIGPIPPEDVDLPGVFVTRVVASTTQLDVQNLPMRVSRPAGSARRYHGKPALAREEIGRRVAALLPDGTVVNLGAGLPALVANFLGGRAVGSLWRRSRGASRPRR